MYCPNCDSLYIIALPQDPELHLCRDCTYQHRLSDGFWKRDFYAERLYEKAASQLGIPLTQLVSNEYQYAKMRE